MARKGLGFVFRETNNKKRKGVHSKNYKKKYRGQGR